MKVCESCAAENRDDTAECCKCGLSLSSESRAPDATDEALLAAINYKPTIRCYQVAIVLLALLFVGMMISDFRIICIFLAFVVFLVAQFGVWLEAPRNAEAFKGLNDSVANKLSKSSHWLPMSFVALFKMQDRFGLSWSFVAICYLLIDISLIWHRERTVGVKGLSQVGKFRLIFLALTCMNYTAAVLLPKS